MVRDLSLRTAGARVAALEVVGNESVDVIVDVGVAAAGYRASSSLVLGPTLSCSVQCCVVRGPSDSKLVAADRELANAIGQPLVGGVASCFGAQDRDRMAGDAVPALGELVGGRFKKMNRAVSCVPVALGRPWEGPRGQSRCGPSASTRGNFRDRSSLGTLASVVGAPGSAQ
jgi:hypothetical protein